MVRDVVFHYNLLPIRLMSALTTGWTSVKPDGHDALHLLSYSSSWEQSGSPVATRVAAQHSGRLGLWAELNNEAAFSLMRAATVALDLPAVAGISKLVAPVVLQAAESERDFIKQGIGAIVCFIMESNGYRKTDTKRSVPGKLFNRGEVYAEA